MPGFKPAAKAAVKGATGTGGGKSGKAAGGGCGTGKGGFKPGNTCGRHGGNGGSKSAVDKAAKPVKPPKAEPKPKTVKVRVEKTAQESSQSKVAKATEGLHALKAGTHGGDAHKHIDKVARGATKGELFDAAKGAGISHAAKTKKDLVAHLKTSHPAGEAGPPKTAGKATIKARVEKVVKQSTDEKVAAATQHLGALKSAAQAGAFDKATIHAHVDRLGKFSTKEELFRAAKEAGISHGAKTKGALVEHLKSHLERQTGIAGTGSGKAGGPVGTRSPVHQKVEKLLGDAVSGKLADKSGIDLRKHVESVTRGATKAQLLEATSRTEGLQHVGAHYTRADIVAAIHGETNFATERFHHQSNRALVEQVRAGKLGLHEAVAKGSGPQVYGHRAEVARAYVESRLSPEARQVQPLHGMTSTESFRSFDHAGVRYHVAESLGSVGHEHPAVRTISDIARSGPTPEALAKHTSEVYFTKQLNKQDSHWKEAYKDVNHVSAATGGDGRVVFYGGSGGLETLHHEMGHNLAAGVYGHTTPTVSSDFHRAATSGEAVPSAYSKNGIHEDFAESVKYHLTDPVKFAADHPQRHAVISKLLKGGTYGG